MARGDRIAVGEDAYRYLNDQAAQRALTQMREELVRALEDMPLSLDRNRTQAIEVIRQLQTLRTLRRKVTATAQAGKRAAEAEEAPKPTHVRDGRWIT